MSLSPAQVLQEEQELAAILRNKEAELQKQIKMQESSVQVSKEVELLLHYPLHA